MPRVIAPAPRETWRRIVSASPLALPEATPEWVDALIAAGSHDDASRLYEFRDGRAAVLPLVRRRGVPGGWFDSYPAGWGIGGPVGPAIDATVVRAIIDDLRRLNAARISIRPDPLSAAVWGHAAAGLPVVTIPRRAHVLDLARGVDAVEAGLRPRTRRNLRTAERRGVTVESDDGGRLLPVYHQLVLRSLDRWAGRQNEPRALARWRGARRDPLSKLHIMASALAGRMRTTIAFVDGQPAAGVIVLQGRTAHYTRGAMDRELAGPSRASVLAQWTAIRHACLSGSAVYHMGETGGSATLAEYKEQFGAVAVPYAEYRFERLPISQVDGILRTTAKRLLRFRDA